MSLKLRKLIETDMEMVMNWRMLPEVTKYMYSEPVLNLEKQKEWYKKVSGSGTDLYWMIEIDETPIGVINLTQIDKKNSRCYWAYYIGDTSFRGRGIARNLECNIYDFVFYEIGLNKLCCEVFSFNDKVVSIHEKFGSEIEGVFKEHIQKNGEFFDIVCMGITKKKWDNIRDNYQYENIVIER